VFAIATVIATGLLLPGVQANSIASSLETAVGISPNVTAAVLAIALGFIIFGGVKRIATFAEIVVPFMALGYIIVAFVVIALNIEQLPVVLKLILNSAFGAEAAYGAILGLAIEWGVKRGVYSNEAGQGTGPHASSAAAVSHPAKQGLVQGFSVYVDTLFVCSATAFMLLITGQYNVQAADGQAIYTGVAGVAAGPGYVQTALENVMPGFGSLFVAIALLFFAFTTIVAYYYIAETNITYLSYITKTPSLLFITKCFIILSVSYGVISATGYIWGIGDIGVGLMAWINIIGIIVTYFIWKPTIKALRDYEQQQKAGVKEFTFDPVKLGIRNATFWEDRIKNKQN